MLLAGGICELGDDCCWQVAAASAAAAGLACECSVVRTNDRIKGKQLAFAIRLLSNHLRSSQLGGLRSQPRSRAHGLGSFKTSSADSFILQRSWQANRSKPRDIRAFFALRMRSSRKPDAPAITSRGPMSPDGESQKTCLVSYYIIFVPRAAVHRSFPSLIVHRSSFIFLAPKLLHSHTLLCLNFIVIKCYNQVLQSSATTTCQGNANARHVISRCQFKVFTRSWRASVQPAPQSSSCSHEIQC